MTEECSKYGAVAGIEIPHVGGPGAGVGFVFVKYHTREDAQKVRARCWCVFAVLFLFYFYLIRYINISRDLRTGLGFQEMVCRLLSDAPIHINVLLFFVGHNEMLRAAPVFLLL